MSAMALAKKPRVIRNFILKLDRALDRLSFARARRMKMELKSKDSYVSCCT